MNNILSQVLNEINAGIIILDENLKILLWTSFMEQITGIDAGSAINKNLYEILPSLKRNYFAASLTNAMEKDYKPFFAAAMHPGLITGNANLNVRVSAFNSDGARFLLIECIDVTSQFIRVNQLKEYVKKLSDLNDELRTKEQEIARLAYYDQLTGVANRRMFYELGNRFLHSAKRNSSVLGLMFIDIDNFKCINDSYGHKTGDKFLVQVAKLLTKSVRKNDIVARYGGDEFIILLPDVKGQKNCEFIASRLVNSLNTVEIGTMEFMASLSIGISYYPKDGDTVDELITKADRAMYQAKDVGGNRYTPYADNMISSCSLLSQGNENVGSARISSHLIR